MEPVRRSHFNQIDDPFRAAFSIGQDDFLRWRSSLDIIGTECCLNRGPAVQLVGKVERIHNRLACPVRSDWKHRMGGIREKRDTAKRPTRQGITITIWVLVQVPGFFDDRGRIYEIQPKPVLYETESFRENAGSTPTLVAWWGGANAAGPRHHRPVGQGTGAAVFPAH